MHLAAMARIVRHREGVDGLGAVARESVARYVTKTAARAADLLPRMRVDDAVGCCRALASHAALG